MSKSKSSEKPEAAKAAPKGRRASIAEAGLRILAAEGARGLTHRAIDGALNLPQGSTSHYFRTRLELLAAITELQVAMTREELRWMDDMAQGRLGKISLEGFSGRLAETFHNWLAPDNRWRIIARSELFLGATREQSLADILSVGNNHFLQQLERMFGLLELQNSSEAAQALWRFGNGYLFSWAIAGSPQPSQEQLENLIQAELSYLHGGMQSPLAKQKPTAGRSQTL